MSRPILFLDFDGVLNSGRYLQEVYAGSDPDGSTADQEQIDPEAVALLNEIVRETGAAIVISSSWRLLHSLAELDALLRVRGLDASVEIVGMTPDIPERSRGYEIQAWLDVQGERPSAFCILDDDADMAHLSRRMVRTSFKEGLTGAHMARTIAMLRRST